MAKTGNQFLGSLVRDVDRIAVNVANAFQTTDATGTPIVSPKVVSTVVIPLVVPDKAIRLIISSITADTRVSEEATAAANYFVVKATTTLTLDCARMSTIYLLRDAAADATVFFAFQTV